MNGLTKSDSTLTGFVCTCFLSGAIDHAELQQWAMKILGENDEYPEYILELIDFNESRFHIYKTIGFVPSAKLSKKEKQTLEQIAYHRKRIKSDNTSLSLLKQSNWINEEIIERFNKTFQNIVTPLKSGTPA